jgi:protein-disulfide isomerase
MKKAITIVVILVLAVGFGYYLYKISPETQNGTNGSVSGYNSSLDTSAAKQLSAVPAFDPAVDRYQGDPKAKNIFIEYADYQCPACAQAADDMKQVPAKFPSTVFVYRYFPLVNIHPNSVESAVAAEAAGVQGKYWEMHDILFQKQGDWEGLSDPLDAFAQYAQQAGVPDINQFKSDVSSKKYLAAVAKNNDEAIGLNLDHTPTYIFNGHVLQNSDLNGLLQQAQQYVVK